ncbi:MAG: GDP-mannose 4,6-dehydratase [Gaiellaceae bacterium]
MATYLVTGCAGFIGSHLSEALVERGDTVIGVDNFSAYYDRSLKEHNLSQLKNDPAFTLLELDLALASLDDAASAADGIFHLAAQPGVRASWGQEFDPYVRDNVLATQRMFELACGRDLRIVWASSSSVYGNAAAYPTLESTAAQPISPYGVTKLTCEQLSAAYGDALGLDSVAMRYFTVYGPRQRPDMAFTQIAQALVRGSAFTLFGTGEQSRDVTYVSDAVNATLLAMDRAASGSVFNIGGGDEVSINRVIELLEAASGMRLKVDSAPTAKGDARRTSADTERARSELGWEPVVSIKEGLRAQLDWVSGAPRLGELVG